MAGEMTVRWRHDRITRLSAIGALGRFAVRRGGRIPRLCHTRKSRLRVAGNSELKFQVPSPPGPPSYRAALLVHAAEPVAVPALSWPDPTNRAPHVPHSRMG